MSRLLPILLILCCWPMLASGEVQSRGADRCTDLERNEVPCPPSELPRAENPTAKNVPSRTTVKLWGHSSKGEETHLRAAADMGSVSVPLDSWVYAAFDRLAALGYVNSAFMGLRPWTRMECARLLNEASGGIDSSDRSEESGLYRALSREFGREAALLYGGKNRAFQIESVYARTTGIAGPAVNQSYYFGQSITNDYGRPYAEGLNVQDGVAGHATLGPMAIYVRGEYQHAPAAAGLPASALTAISNDYWREPAPAGAAVAQIHRVRLLDAYATFQTNDWQFSFGRQSLWWGPGASGPLSFSNNAAPITMLRVSRVSGGVLPSFLSWLGPVRSEFFVGRLAGQHFVNLGGTARVGNAAVALGDQPFVHGEKFSFKPTPNLEFGVSRTGIFGGPGYPLTPRSIANVLFSTGTSFGRNDPGDRRSGFDFSYRVPYLRNWLILYSDSMTEDEISPIGYPRRAAFNPGVYLPRIPKIPKLDFRAEAVYTDLPGLRPQGFFYFNVRYLAGYTNQGNILGNWVGREGRGVQLRSTYWLSARNTIGVEYRGQRVDRNFLQGGSLDGFTVRNELVLNDQMSLSGSLQYQRWNFPALARGTQSLVLPSVQLTYWPKW